MVRSHLASATLVVIALLVAGCGSGGSATRGFGALPKAAPASPAAPPVVLAEPAPAAKPATPAVTAAPVVAKDDKALAKSRATAKKLRHQRAVARHKLQVERRKAAVREAKLRKELAAAKVVTPTPAPSHRATHHKTAPAAPIAASDVTDDKQRAARVVVVRFFDLMDKHDGTACDMLSVRFLHDHFPGDDTDTQRANCSTGVESLQSPVSVYVRGSGREGTGIWVDAISRLGDGQAHQIIHLVPFFSSWMIDAVEAAPSR